MGIKGAIIGDIMGSKYEFCGCNNPFTCELIDKDCFFTDDTILSCATKEAVLDNIAFSKAYKDYARNYMWYTPAGWGANFRLWIAGDKHFRQSIGNGSAMRVGFLADYYNNPLKGATEAGNTALTTHGTEDGVLGAELVTYWSIMAKKGDLTKDILKEAADKFYPKYAGWTLDDYRKHYQWSELCRDSIHLAATCLVESNSFEMCLRNVLSVRCDTDTIGAIAGNMAESYYGDVGRYWDKAEAKLSEQLKNVVRR